MADRHDAGILDTCTYIDLATLNPRDLPRFPALTSITMAELHQGIAMAKDPLVRAARTEQLGAALTEFTPLKFDDEAAARYGTLVTLTIAANRDPKPRRLDLMIAAVASASGLPLYTRNAADFKGLESMLEMVAV